MRHRTCAAICFAMLSAACSPRLDQNLENRACSSDGECLPGYACTLDNICIPSEAAMRRPAAAGRGNGTRTDALGASQEQVEEIDAGVDVPSGPSSGSDAAPPTSDDGGQSDASTDAFTSEANTCPENARCDGSCRHLDRDPDHCGACGRRCEVPVGGAARCVEGECTIECSAPRSRCGKRCVDLETDLLHCGGCEVACIPPGGGNASCVESKCQRTCTDGRTVCGDTCVNLAESLEHCGACNVACSQGRSCNDGACRAKGVDVAELDRLLRPHGYTAQDFANRLGIPFEQLEGAHVTLEQIVRAGISRARLEELGISLEDLARAGIDVSAARDAGI